MATREEVRTAALGTLARIAPEADLETLADEADLRRELDLDSVDFQNFLIGLSQSVAAEIPAREAATLTSLDACMRRLGTEAPPG